MPVAESTAPATTVEKFSVDFWKFWLGQTTSSFGSSFTNFALPLLIFRLTGSAVNLALSTATIYLPFLLFGLVVGAWVDRVNRKRLMISIDACRAVLIGSVALLATFNLLTVWWIYGLGFVTATLGVCYGTAISAAVPSLTGHKNLAAANGRVQATSSAANASGPILAGLLVAFLPIQTLLFWDAVTFLFSATMLLLIKTSFNAANKKQSNTTIRQDIGEGINYVVKHPVLPYVVVMLTICNFFTPTIIAQVVFFNKNHMGATDTQVGLCYSAGSIGIVTLSLLAGRLSKRWSFGTIALGAMLAASAAIIGLAFVPNYWLSLPLWFSFAGLFALFDINYSSLRQAIVPGHLLGRVVSVSRMCAFSVAPLGVFIGGILIDTTHNISLIFGLIGGLVMLITIGFSFTPLGHTERYLAPKETIAKVETT